MPSKPADVIAALRAEGFDPAPHELGLALHAVDPAAYARELRKIAKPLPTPASIPARPRCHGYANGCICDRCATRAGIRLHIVTAGPSLEVACDGTYTCPCQRCRGTVATLEPRGAGPAAFGVRPARRAA